MRSFLIVAALLFACLAGAARADGIDCSYNNCSHDALHGAFNHVDVLSAPERADGKGHDHQHPGSPAVGTSTHADVHCAHDTAHHTYCAASCQAHHATEKAACGMDHSKDCGVEATLAKGDTNHACEWNCDHHAWKCPHCGHAHCGLHAWACHTTHHQIIGTHACAHEGPDAHCHTDGLKPDVRALVEEVRMHHQLRG